MNNERPNFRPLASCYVNLIDRLSTDEQRAINNQAIWRDLRDADMQQSRPQAQGFRDDREQSRRPPSARVDYEHWYDQSPYEPADRNRRWPALPAPPPRRPMERGERGRQVFDMRRPQILQTSVADRALVRAFGPQIGFHPPYGPERDAAGLWQRECLGYALGSGCSAPRCPCAYNHVPFDGEDSDRVCALVDYRDQCLQRARADRPDFQ